MKRECPTVEQAWLEWSRQVCRRGDRHQSACLNAQHHLRLVNEPEWDRIVAPGLRWPGYLGSDYERGGVLSVGIVHTSFATGGMETGPEVPAAVAAHEAWTAGNLSDSEWLTAMRAMYRKGLTWQRGCNIGWAVATYHHQYWAALGETVDSVAYVNAMRCQYPGDQPAPPVQRRCLQALPLTELVEILEPRLVISNSEPAKKQLDRLVPTLYVNQRGGMNLRPVTVRTSDGSVTIPKGNLPYTISALVGAGLGRRTAR